MNKKSSSESAHESVRVLILTTPFGGGHIRTARTLADLIRTEEPTAQIEVIDMLSDGWPRFSKVATKTYATTTSSLSAAMYQLYYRLTDAYPAPLRALVVMAARKYIDRLCRAKQPTLVIATFPFIADIIAASRRRGAHHASIVQTVTDAGKVQGIWIAGGADMTLTATPDTVDYLVKRGMSSEKVMYRGFLAAPDTYKSYDKSSVRRHLGLDDDIFTILVTAGGDGLQGSSVLALVNEIAKIKQPLQIVLNAGRNDTLRRQFDELSFPHAHKVVVEGFTDKLVDYMRAADLLCVKAGWLTLTEGTVLKKPMLIYDHIPGQETQNVSYMVGRKFAVYEQDPERAARHIEHVASDASLADSYAEAMHLAHTEDDPSRAIMELLRRYLRN